MVQRVEYKSKYRQGKGPKKSRQKSMQTREHNTLRHTRILMASSFPKLTSATRVSSRMNRLFIVSSMAKRS
eukprot:5574182-Heterocapsa_arctica.AAC.1